MSKFIDLTGQQFGRLTVIKRVKNKKHHTYWKCQCSCGNIVTINAYNLRSKHTKSCGCLKKETDGKHCIIHNMSNSSEYKIWSRMISRCCNPKNTAFKYYGGRGIIVCNKWKNSFIKFYEDMGPRPSKKYTLERIDNNGNYEPSNCKWATRKEQVNNTRQNNKITINGITMNISQWAEYVNKSVYTIRTRIRRGWSPKQAIFKPINKYNYQSKTPRL